MVFGGLAQAKTICPQHDACMVVEQLREGSPGWIKLFGIDFSSILSWLKLSTKIPGTCFVSVMKRGVDLVGPKKGEVV